MFVFSCVTGVQYLFAIYHKLVIDGAWNRDDGEFNYKDTLCEHISLMQTCRWLGYDSFDLADYYSPAS